MANLQSYWFIGQYFDLLVYPVQPVIIDDPNFEWINYPSFDVYVKDAQGNRISTYGTTAKTPELWLSQNDNVNEQQALLQIWSETYG